MPKAGKTKLKFFTPNVHTNYRILSQRRAVVQSRDEGAQLNFVILHGWHSLYDPMTNLERALRRLPGAEGVRFWQVTYNTHWRPFSQTSREVVRFLRGQSVQPENTILLGFSMGGIIARSMGDDGFVPRHTFCLCSPHLGPAFWMPPGDFGSLSITSWSYRLANLNRSPRDTVNRSRCSLYGISFQDAMGYHAHDRIVKLESALAEGLPGFAVRHEVKLRYKGIASGCDPHVQGMLPENLAPLLDECEELFSKPAGG